MIKCEEVLKLLYEYIDKQLDQVSIAQIEEHIELCKYCRRYHDFEIALQKLLHQCCFQRKAPDLLKDKIRDMLKDPPPE